ncbi:PepSY domain-containing protein [Thermococcus stetteri]|uniref:PepSY domain-containing protein n=1 Tax=Thermococcus stetteri TaxID=49900 RepID=UPI001AE26EA0|nr:putative membrane protein YkoI [Thermococcus stetteri]
MKWKFNIGLKVVAVIVALIVTVGVGAFAVAASDNTSNSTSDTNSPTYVGSISVPQDVENEKEDQEAKTLQDLAKITVEQAKDSALSVVNGTINKVELGNENGYLVYSVEVKTADGVIKDVKVDAGNGKVLQIDTDNEMNGMEKENEKEKEQAGEKEDDESSADNDNIQEESEQEEG